MTLVKVILQKQPENYYQKTDTKTAKALAGCFKQLQANPFYHPSKIKRLKGREGLFRYALGGLRVIYEIDPEGKKVNVLLIRPRGDVYKKL